MMPVFSMAVIALLSFISHTGQSPSRAAQPFVSSCKVDAEISAADRDAVDRAALQFVNQAMGPDTMKAYSSMTAEAKKAVSAADFEAIYQQFIKPNGPYTDVHVSHTYLARVVGGTEAQSVVCGGLSRPQDWVAVTVQPGPAQAHVIVEASTFNNTFAFVLWLSLEQENWHIVYSQIVIERSVGKSAEDFQALADAELQKQHIFNAYILEAAALQLADRGPNLQLGILPEIQKAFGELHPPRELQGQAPFNWEFGKSSFKVMNVSALGIAGKIYLQIDQEIEPWTEDKVADQKNRELIAAFASAFPQYKSAFSGLAVRAHERGGNRGFGTVDANDHP